MTVVGVVVGPTGSGKSAVAMDMAMASPGTEIISVDSMQVYREMDIGTAKPTQADRQRVRHHMVDIVDPSSSFSVAEFQEQGRRALEDIAAPLVVGGSGLHMRALIDPLEFPPTDADLRAELDALDFDELRARLLELDPAAGEVIDMANRRRVIRAAEVAELAGETPSARRASPLAQAVADYTSAYDVAIVGIDPGEALAERVIERVDAMLAAGWLKEATSLQGRLGPTAAGAIGYPELIEVSRGASELAAARETIIAATMALAKRQRTFFRRDPRVRWLPWLDGHDDMVTAAANALEEAKWSS